MPVPSLALHAYRQSLGKGGKIGGRIRRGDPVETLGVETDVSFHGWNRPVDKGIEMVVLASSRGNVMVPSHCRDTVPDESDSRDALTVC